MKPTEIFLVSLFIATTACSAEEELKRIEHNAFNEVVKAEQSNEKWASHPVAVSLLFIKHYRDGDKVVEHQEQITLKSTPERFVDAVVTIERSGFLDDSIAGDKYVIVLGRQPGNEWLIESAQYGRRCREGRGHANYSNEPCN